MVEKAFSLVALTVDEGLGEIKWMAIYRHPLTGEHSGHPAQDMRGKVFNANPG